MVLSQRQVLDKIFCIMLSHPFCIRLLKIAKKCGLLASPSPIPPFWLGTKQGWDETPLRVGLSPACNRWVWTHRNSKLPDYLEGIFNCLGLVRHVRLIATAQFSINSGLMIAPRAWSLGSRQDSRRSPMIADGQENPPNRA